MAIRAMSGGNMAKKKVYNHSTDEMRESIFIWMSVTSWFR
jgi:hypothetical protein